jgi:FixJ family two-component response regulator
VFATAPDVVLIDDDDSVREALSDLLDFMGLTVEAHRSVQAFLEMQPRVRPKCIILDVWLPGRSGLDFQADLVKADSETPVIFISGHADVHMSVRAMKAGAVDFLTKPLRHEELLAAVQSVVAREAPRAFV